MTDREKPEATPISESVDEAVALMAKGWLLRLDGYSDAEGTASFGRDVPRAIADRLAAMEAELAKRDNLLQRLLDDDRSRFGDNSIYPDLIRWSEERHAPEPNARALYVRTDIDTAEEIVRLRDALEPRVNEVEKARREAFEEAAAIAEKWEGKPCRPNPSWTDDQASFYEAGEIDASSSIAGAIRRLIATPPQPAPTVQEAADFEGFSREVMEAWPEGGIDGFDLQDIAVKHRLIVEVPGGFDPDRHEDIYGVDVERGDQWFERNYPRALSQQEGGENG